MSIFRSVARQIALSFVVLSAVFAAGFFAGSSSAVSDMYAKCMVRGGEWADGFCTLAERSR